VAERKVDLARPWPPDLRSLPCDCPPLRARRPRENYCTKNVARCNGMLRSITDWQNRQDLGAPPTTTREGG